MCGRDIKYFHESSRQMSLIICLDCAPLCCHWILFVVFAYTCKIAPPPLSTTSTSYPLSHSHFSSHAHTRTGDEGSPTSVVCSSNLRRAAQTAAVALWDRLRPDDDDEALAAGTQPGSYPEQVKVMDACVRVRVVCFCLCKGKEL